MYCRYKDTLAQNPSDLASSLCGQLCQGRNTLPKEVSELYNKHQGVSRRPDSDEVLKIFQAVLVTYVKVFIVIDALDECSKYAQSFLLENLIGLSSNINVLITSRHLENIMRRLRAAPTVEIRAHIDDVRGYVIARLDTTSLSYHRVGEDPSSLGEIIGDDIVLKKEVLITITQNAKDMYDKIRMRHPSSNHK